jgi:hypothetical protein
MLTAAEKEAGHTFRDLCVEALRKLQGDNLDGVNGVPWTLGGYRHECTGAGKGSLAAASGRTVLLPLALKHWSSPAIGSVPAGVFAYVFSDGKCKQCGLHVISSGTLLDTRTSTTSFLSS